MFKISIDAGHGGKDPGALGVRSQEKDLNLRDALLLYNRLREFKGIEVKLTRATDVFLELTDRGRLAGEFKADLAISIHKNSFNTPVTGTEVFYSVKRPGDKTWADELSLATSKTLGIPNRGGKTWESQKYPGQDYLTYINSCVKQGIKHILIVEQGFINNIGDEEKLLNPILVDEYIEDMVRVICKLAKVEYKPKEVIKVQEVKKSWEQSIGEKAVDNLYNKGLINEPGTWKSKDLKEPVPLWLFFELLDRTTKY